jgi:hypothetical protein
MLVQFLPRARSGYGRPTCQRLFSFFPAGVSGCFHVVEPDQWMKISRLSFFFLTWTSWRGGLLPAFMRRNVSSRKYFGSLYKCSCCTFNLRTALSAHLATVYHDVVPQTKMAEPSGGGRRRCAPAWMAGGGVQLAGGMGATHA